MWICNSGCAMGLAHSLLVLLGCFWWHGRGILSCGESCKNIPVNFHHMHKHSEPKSAPKPAFGINQNQSLGPGQVASTQHSTGDLQG